MYEKVAELIEGELTQRAFARTESPRQEPREKLAQTRKMKLATMVMQNKLKPNDNLIKRCLYDGGFLGKKSRGLERDEGQTAGAGTAGLGTAARSLAAPDVS